MPNLPILTNMIHHTLLPGHHIDTPLERIPHMQIDFDFRPGEFRGYEHTGLRFPGQQRAEDQEVRTLGIVEDPAHQAVPKAERRRGQAGETFLGFGTSA